MGIGRRHRPTLALARFGIACLAVMLPVGLLWHACGRLFHLPLVSATALAAVFLWAAAALVRAAGVRPGPAAAVAAVAAGSGYLAWQGADYLYFRQQAAAATPPSVGAGLAHLGVSEGQAVDDMLQARTGGRGLDGYLRYRARLLWGATTGPARRRLLTLWSLELLLVMILPALAARARAAADDAGSSVTPESSI